MAGPFDEFTERLGNGAKDGVKSAVLEYLKSPQGDQKVSEGLKSLKTFLFVVGGAVAYHYVKKGGS